MSRKESDYPQPPELGEIDLQEFLSRAPIARLATHCSDGTIHIAPVWFKYVDGEILIPTQEITRKVKNIKGNNVVSVLIDTQEPPYVGALIYGRGFVDYDNVFEKKTEIYRKYFAEDKLPDPRQLAEKFVPVIVRIVPERIVTFNDQSTRF